LIHSFRRVQQLLVRVIFLPGISDGSKPIRHSHLVEQISSRMRSRRYRPADQEDNDGLICFTGRHLGADFRESDCGPAITTASQGRLIRRLPCTGARVAFAGQSLSEESSLPKVSGRAARFTWSRHHVQLLFLPGI